MSAGGRAALAQRIRAGDALVAGVLSGTSADGIDVALVRFEPVPRARRSDALGPRARRSDALGRPRCEAFETLAFPAELARRVERAIAGLPHAPRELALLDRDLGRAFGRAARTVADRSGAALDLVGSHGQTIWHHDGVEPSGRATLQLGHGAFAAEEAGCAVASDFRQRDVAAGGEGAPIAALVDGLLFPDLARPAAILNLGGIGNLTILARAGEPLLSFDTGPANCLLDGLARRLLDQPCDRDGAAALAGRANERLLAELLRHPFYARRPPKSTGRDTFGAAWIEGVSARAAELGAVRGGRRCEDVFATAVELVAETAASALARFAAQPVHEVAVAGGGALNPALMRALERRVRASVRSSAAHGIDPKAREAIAFAALGACTVLEIPLTDTTATGAGAGRILGQLCDAPT